MILRGRDGKEARFMRKCLLSALGFLAIFVLLIASIGQSRDVHPPTSTLTSLCQILSNPTIYSGQVVRFRARTSTDGFESSTLYDPKCNQGVSPWSSEETDKHKDVRAFNHTFEAQGHGVAYIDAVFMGRFTYDKSASIARRRDFEILEVSEMRVSKTKRKSSTK
jgi:hypothetical protein